MRLMWRCPWPVRESQHNFAGPERTKVPGRPRNGCDVTVTVPRDEVLGPIFVMGPFEGALHTDLADVDEVFGRREDVG